MKTDQQDQRAECFPMVDSIKDTIQTRGLKRRRQQEEEDEEDEGLLSSSLAGW